MHRFYLPPAECQRNPLILTGREAHHARNVLRVGERERVVVLNGAGDEFLCEVQKADRREVVLRVLQKNLHPPLPWQITLIQALTKGRTMDLILQKATELGVQRIVPILSERTVARVGSHTAPRTLKWEETAIEAIKQCGSAWLPRVEAALTPQAFLARDERFELPLLASLQSDARHPREHFHSYFLEHRRPPRSVCVWVGPEGDFTPGEIQAIRAAGALSITLGQLILRSETAAIYCLAVINYELQSPVG
jgi:16S rRNA (uracil1498-N3)-methyltransferase